ncbi:MULTISPECIES: HAD family hydrolase [unclassified Dietzia]|uniref:HAD family hydrolase n=1 Tax=unclassified Dietzia TaxID=2617939 RepID=UPI0015F889C1|nr:MULTISPECIES: HAD-IA family hydrolase [unclassified Dietzia]MBB1023686.1 HAD-IA family hydrolase [Dietzia sp. DQ12-76]MBB1027246.1 HAD-IA family hydrolase [Dietzia sp. DQ11-38-2]
MTWALLFDLDDTLIDECDYQKSAANAIAHYLEATGFPIELVCQAIRCADPPGSPRRYQQILRQIAMPGINVTVDDLIRVHREHSPMLSFRPDVLPMLQMLQGIDVRLGIVTDGAAITQRKKLNAVNADYYFDSLVVTDELGPNRSYWKPHPRPFRLACRQLNVPLSRAIYVGDNPEKDFHISSVLPVTTVRLLRQDGIHCRKRYLEGVTEHHSVTALTEIPELVKSIGARVK